jgi:hypothetical protein
MAAIFLTNFTGYAKASTATEKYMLLIYPQSTTAVENMITAYNDAAGRPSPDFLELGAGNIMVNINPGLYKWTSTVSVPAYNHFRISR